MENPWEDLSSGNNFYWFRCCMRKVCLSEVELLDWEKFNLDFSKCKVIFLPYYFLIRVKGLLGVKLSLKSILVNWNTLKAWEKRGENKEKGEKAKNSSNMPRFSSGIIVSDPYKVCEIFFYWICSHTHTNMFNSACS